ncbi:MAG: hypothetical protein RAO94_02995, partial [Candidatus Stygibacter australis]|nr:hypothetical protein [Candidatus Stygibacter australis]
TRLQVSSYLTDSPTARFNEAKPVRFRYGLLTDSKSFDYSITGNNHLFHFRLNRKLTGLDFHQLEAHHFVTHQKAQRTRRGKLKM